MVAIDKLLAVENRIIVAVIVVGVGVGQRLQAGGAVVAIDNGPAAAPGGVVRHIGVTDIRMEEFFIVG